MAHRGLYGRLVVGTGVSRHPLCDLLVLPIARVHCVDAHQAHRPLGACDRFLHRHSGAVCAGVLQPLGNLHALYSDLSLFDPARGGRDEPRHGPVSGARGEGPVGLDDLRLLRKPRARDREP